MVDLTIKSYDDIWGLMCSLWRTRDLQDQQKNKQAYLYMWSRCGYTVKDLNEAVYRMAKEIRFFPTISEIDGYVNQIYKERKLLSDRNIPPPDPENVKRVQEILSSVFNRPQKDPMEF